MKERGSVHRLRRSVCIITGEGVCEDVRQKIRFKKMKSFKS